MAKKTKDYKSMKPEDLKKELIANRKVLFENNFKHKMGQLKESHMLKETKKEIALIEDPISNYDLTTQDHLEVIKDEQWI